MARGLNRRRTIPGLIATAALSVAAPAQAGYYTDFNPFPVLDNGQAGGLVSCERNDIAIGGGVRVPGATYADGVYLNTSRPDPVLNPMGESWQIYVDNYVGGPAVTPEAYAVCDSKGKPEDYTLRSAGAAITVNDGTSFGGIAECEGSEVAVGGGGRSIDGVYADENYHVINSPWDDPGEKGKDPDDGWQFELANDEGGAASNQISVYAVCDEKNNASKFNWVKKKVDVQDAELKTAAAKCGSQTLVGGGVYGNGTYEHGIYVGQTFPRSLGGGKKAWTASVHNYETPDDETRNFTVWAICKK